MFLTLALYQRNQVRQSHEDWADDHGGSEDPTPAIITRAGHRVEAARRERLHYQGMELPSGPPRSQLEARSRSSKSSTRSTHRYTFTTITMSSSTSLRVNTSSLSVARSSRRGQVTSSSAQSSAPCSPSRVRALVATSKCSHQPAARPSSETSLTDRTVRWSRGSRRIAAKFGVTFLVCPHPQLASRHSDHWARRHHIRAAAPLVGAGCEVGPLIVTHAVKRVYV